MFRNADDNPQSPASSDEDYSLESKKNVSLQSGRKRRSTEQLNKSVGQSPPKRQTSSFQESSDSEDSGPERKHSVEMVEELDLSKASIFGENIELAETDSFVNKTVSFAIGGFIVLKYDFHHRNCYPIWRIEEGLLQRFIPIVKDGKTFFKNTHHFLEWDIFQKEQYYSAPVTSVSEHLTEIIVELDLDLLKKSIC